MLRSLLQCQVVLTNLLHSNSRGAPIVCRTLQTGRRYRSSPFGGTVAEFQGAVSSAPTFVNFYTSWCAPCHKFAPEYERLSEEFPSIAFLNVDVEACEEVSALHDIRSIPTFLAFKQGHLLGRVEGAQLDEMKRLLSDLGDPSKRLPDEPAEDPQS